ncbi:MAG: hypothetical protein Q4D53_05515, partial [Leptotrichiaceae bacterium]|nr:hypothetical protein [Leptotrichiaceae bacterium]
IKRFKEERLTDKIYCNSNNHYMVYYTEGENLEIGFVFNEKERKELALKDLLDYFEKSADYLNEIKNFEYPISKEELPLNFNLRIYVYDPYDDDTIMVFKAGHHIPTNETTLFYNREYVELFENFSKILDKSGFYPTEDVVY